MPQKFCEEGMRLDTVYFERTRAWIGAEADKRVAVAMSRTVSPDEWNEIARRATEAKVGHQQALREYMEHVITCPVCNAHILASSSGYLADHLH